MVFIGAEGGIWTGEDGFFPYAQGADPGRAQAWGRKGVLPGGFVADTGADYTLPGTLEPLAALREDVLLISGLHHRNDEIPSRVVSDHGQDLGTLLTGCNISGTPGVALRNGVSVDQYVASRLGDATRLPSLELVTDGASFNTREATGQAYMGYLSYDDEGYALPVEADPSAVFDRLFTDGTAAQRAERAAIRRQRKSLLDSLLRDMARLSGRVAAQDRRKLDEYCTTIREVERRIERAARWEETPVATPPGARRPEPVPARVGSPQEGDGRDREARARLMLDILALALQADVTRIATLRLGGYYGSFRFLGLPEDPHASYAHNHGDPERVRGARSIDRFHVGLLAYFLEKLKGIEEGGGSLLDHAMIFYGAGLTNGPSPRLRGGQVWYNAHTHVNCPILIAGRGGGGLRTGRHVNYDDGTPLANLFVTMMELMGLRDDRFADSTGPLTDLV
jgi:hypothetical protein